MHRDPFALPAVRRVSESDMGLQSCRSLPAAVTDGMSNATEISMKMVKIVVFSNCCVHDECPHLYAYDP